MGDVYIRQFMIHQVDHRVFAEMWIFIIMGGNIGFHILSLFLLCLTIESINL